jgi:hypothetical protein
MFQKKRVTKSAKYGSKTPVLAPTARFASELLALSRNAERDVIGAKSVEPGSGSASHHHFRSFHSFPPCLWLVEQQQ